MSRGANLAKWQAENPDKIGRRAGIGRQKGTPNKFTRTVKETILQCFEDIGGRDAFAKWARRNPTEFYKLYGKVLPLSLQGDGSKEFILKFEPDDEDV